MNLFSRLAPMWVCSFFTYCAIFMAVKPYPTVTFLTSQSASIPPQKSAPEFSPQMKDQSSGVPVVQVVHHQDLNKKILIALVVASTILVSVLILLLYLWFFRCRNPRSSSRKKDNLEATEDPSPKGKLDKARLLASEKGKIATIEYQILDAATKSFHESNFLGECGRGQLYKAGFTENFSATVKKLDSQGLDAEKEFETEMNWMIKIQHQNIITLLGRCIHGETRLFVYEMVQNGTLENQLLGPSKGSALTWNLRMKVAVDIARGLEYLHEHCNPPVIHRDLTTSNILLDSDFSAKISGFGSAVTVGNKSKGLKLSGTSAYVAPEFLQEGKLTDKSDVYSFGVILLELLVGKKPLEKLPEECKSIVRWAVPKLSDRAKLPTIIDPVIKDTMDLKHMYQVAAVAVLCVQPEPSYRPLITDVLHSLIPLLHVELGGSLRVS